MRVIDLFRGPRRSFFKLVVTLSLAAGFSSAGDALAQTGVPVVGYLTSASGQAGGDGSDPSSLSFSFDSNTVPDAVKSALVVCVSIRKPAGALPSVSSVTFNGDSFFNEQTRDNTAGTLRVELYVLVAPDMGNHTLAVTLSGPAESIIVGVVQATNVDQVNPVRSSTNGRNANSALATQTITSATGDLVVDVLAVFGNITATVGSGQTQRWNRNTNTGSANLTGTGSTEPGAAPTVAMDWTLSASTAWVAAVLSLQPDAVTLASGLEAEAIAGAPGAGVAVRWGTEDGGRDLLGFEVVRAGTDGRLERASGKGMIAGGVLLSSAALATGRKYSFFDPKGSAGTTYWIDAIWATGIRERFGPIYAGGGSSKGTFSEESSLSLDRLSESRAVSRAVLPTYEQQNARTLVEPWSIGAGKAIKIGIDQPGWYRITQPELLAAGLDPAVDPARLQLWAGNVQVPIKVAGDSRVQLRDRSSIEFFGVPLDTEYSGERVYWLIEGSSPGSRITQRSAKKASAAPAMGVTELDLRESSIYYAALSNGSEDNFFGALVTANGTSQPFSARSVDRNGAASVAVRLQGVTAGDHRVEASLNGVVLGNVRFRDKEIGATTFTVPQAVVLDGDNNLLLRSLSGLADFSLVDRIGVTYTRASVAWGDELAMTYQHSGPDGDGVLLSGFSSNLIRAFDIANPHQPIELSGAVRDRSIVIPGSGSQFLYAITEAGVKRPAWIRANVPSSLSSGGAEYLVITHKTFRNAADRLALLRSSQPSLLSTRVVDVEDVYDEFGFGAKEPAAIAALLAHARATWRPAPRFVVLLGDGSFDPRNHLGGSEQTWIPTPLIDTEFFQGASDDALVDFDGDGLADLALGRFPVQDVAQANAAVSKLETYGPHGPGTRRAVLAADLNEGSNFEFSSAGLEALLPSGVEVGHAYREEVGTANARQMLLDAFSGGSFLVNYAGHGSVDSWRANLLTSDDAAAMPSNLHPPLVTVESCLTGYFLDFTLTTLGEALFRAPGGGAIAVLASSGINRSHDQDVMMREFYRRVFASSATTVGEAALGAKAAVTGDVRRTSTLLGDPALRLSY